MDRFIPFLGSGHEGPQNRSETLSALEAIVRETMYGFENLHYAGFSSDAEAIKAGQRMARLQAVQPEKIAVSKTVAEAPPLQVVPKPEAAPNQLTELSKQAADAASPLEQALKHFTGGSDEDSIAA